MGAGGLRCCEEISDFRCSLQRDAVPLLQPTNKLSVIYGFSTKGAGRHTAGCDVCFDISEEGLGFAHAHYIMGFCPSCQWSFTQWKMGKMMGRLPL